MFRRVKRVETALPYDYNLLSHILCLRLSVGHGKPVDWWTLGILIYEMIVGFPPFCDEDPLGIYRKILDGKITFPRIFDK